MLTNANAPPKCKCGAEMCQVNTAFLPGVDKYKWTCPLQRWWNYFAHTIPFRSANWQ